MRLRHFRKKAGLRQKDVAAKIGVAPSTYSSYEQGKAQPDIQTLYKLAKLYHVTLEVICGFTTDEDNLTITIKREELTILMSSRVIFDRILSQAVLQIKNPNDK